MLPITYSYYSHKEFYPFAFQGSNELKILNSLPKNFYNYRSNINYNDETVIDYFSYYWFMVNHFNNLALSKHFKHSADSTLNASLLDYNLHKLSIIDSMVTNDSLKNALLLRAAYRFINTSKKISDYEPFLNSFLDKSTHKKNNTDFAEIVNALKTMIPESVLPNLNIVNTNNQTILLHSLIQQPTAIYFWSSNFFEHFTESHSKIKALKKKYPEVLFMGISIDNDGEIYNQFEILNKYGYTTTNEFQFKNLERGKKGLGINALNKVILVDKNKLIVNPNSNMFTINFEQELLGAINR